LEDLEVGLEELELNPFVKVAFVKQSVVLISTLSSSMINKSKTSLFEHFIDFEEST